MTGVTTRFGWRYLVSTPSTMMPTDQEEDEMRKITTIAIILVMAAITTAWSVSSIQPGSRGATIVGSGGTVPTHGVLSW